MIFVVAFDRETSERRTYTAFHDSARHDAEALYRTILAQVMADGSALVEVNMFESDDEETFKLTHARYFQTDQQALQAVRSSLVA